MSGCLLVGCTSTDGEDVSGSATGSPSAAATEPTSTEATPTEPTPTEATPRPTEDAAPTDERSSPNPVPTTADPRIARVGPGQWRDMVRAGMIRPECPVQRPGQLRRVLMNHHGFGGGVRRGEVVVHRDVAASIARVLTRLFRAGFPIRRMRPMEHYDGQNIRSLRADNTAAFNCRQPDEINAPFMDSPHANGRAIDINPVENPWLDLRCDCWSPGPRHARRTPGRGKVLQGGVVWRAFVREGWIWQNIDVPDYMHFDTGYPSGPFSPTLRGR